jgi:hypothetical protein
MVSAMNASRHALIIVSLLFLVMVPAVRAQDGDLDAYKWRVTGMWWLSHPTGNFRAAGSNGFFDLNQDFHFSNYSTFTGKVDWHFKRKHHLLLAASPVNFSRTVAISRDITFQGVTYHAGTQVTAKLESLSFGLSYQYDIFRRNHGYLALLTTVSLLDTKGSLTGTGTLNNQSGTFQRSASVFAPLPIIGPKFRWYPMPRSSRLSLDGTLQGMYFFGYGDFVSAQTTVGVEATRHLALRAGYQMGTRFNLHGSSSRVGVRLTQKGPVAGIELSW